LKAEGIILNFSLTLETFFFGSTTCRCIVDLGEAVTLSLISPQKVECARRAARGCVTRLNPNSSLYLNSSYIILHTIEQYFITSL
jgi:hypothetical protein